MTHRLPLRDRAAALVSVERLLAAACVGSLTSFFLKLADTLKPGIPQSQILASKHVPFFAHMITVGWVAALVWLGSGGVAPRLRPLAGWLVAGAMTGAAATGLVQWFFPNY